MLSDDREHTFPLNLQSINVETEERAGRKETEEEEEQEEASHEGRLK